MASPAVPASPPNPAPASLNVPPSPLTLRDKASSKLTASPHIPAHLLGAAHPRGASAGTVSDEKVARPPLPAPAPTAAVDRVVLRGGGRSSTDDADEEKHVRGFDDGRGVLDLPTPPDPKRFEFAAMGVNTEV